MPSVILRRASPELAPGDVQHLPSAGDPDGECLSVDGAVAAPGAPIQGEETPGGDQNLLL